MSVRVATVMILTALLAYAAACASSNEPAMSGFGLGKSRMVKVGQIVELRLPLREDGSRNWQITSYDSLYLSIDRQPNVVINDSGHRELVLRARARNPGKTTVEITELVPPATGRSPRIETFKVQIIE